MATVRQADFTGGEIDPRLWGKTTAQKAPTYVRTMKNMIAVPQGAAMNRAGTQFVALTRDQTQAPQLIPFLWPSQNYLLEVSAGFIRVYANGVFVVDVAASVVAGSLGYLKWSQKDDEMILTYGGQNPIDIAQTPQRLRRVSHAVWTIGGVNFTPPAATVNNIYLTDANGNLTASPVAVPDPVHVAQPWNIVFTLTVREVATGRVTETSIVQRLTDSPIYTDAASTIPLAVAYNPASTYAAGHPVTYLGQLWTSLQAANTGNTPGDAASAAWWAPGLSIYADAPVYYRVANVITNAATLVVGYQVLAVNVYRGKHGVYGLLGDVEVNSGQSIFADVGDTPNYAIQPPQGTDPFELFDANGNHLRFDYPACVTHFQQRRIYGRTGSHLGRINGSKPGQPDNFDETDIVQDSDAINFDLSSQGIEDIRSLVSARALIVLTSTGATVVRGSGSQRGGSTAITPGSVDATKQGTRGASWVDPVVVDNTILYAGAKGSEVRAVTYDPYYEVLGTPGADVGLVAQHLLRGHTIVDMTWQSTPDSIVWLVRDDGLWLGVTFVPAQQPDDAIHGWHQHPTNGAVQRVCSVPEGTEDVLYLVVQRGGAFLLEKLASRNLPLLTYPAPTKDDPTATKTVEDVRLGVFLDSSKTFDGRNTGATTMAFVSDAGTYAGGEEGTITASANSFVGASDEGDQVVLDPDGKTGGPFSLTILAYTDATHVRAILNNPLPAGFQIATPIWAFARDTMAGLDHLEARDVMVLADGAVQGPFTVAAGNITLTRPAVIVTAGLAYVSDLELLDIIPDQVRANVKSIPRVFLEVVASRGILVGQSATDKLRAWASREKPDPFGNPPPVTDQIEVGIDSDWNRGGRAFIRQVDPLPLTVTAASRELVVGGA
jgi:hypothetical protein